MIINTLENKIVTVAEDKSVDPRILMEDEGFIKLARRNPTVKELNTYVVANY